MQKSGAPAAEAMALLQSLPVLVVLIEGKRLIPNATLKALYSPFPATDLSGLIPAPQRAAFEQLLESVRRNHLSAQTLLEFGPPDQRACYDCLLVHIGKGRVLLLATPLPAQTASPPLLGPLEQLNAELQEVRRKLEIKEKELQAVLAQVDEVAHTDPLTYLSNRRHILGELQREVMRSERYNTPLSISMIDLDHFKRINDTYGHSAGDQVLRFVAMQLRDHIRLPDIIGRYGGEEFLVLLPNSMATAAGEQAARLCQHIRSTPVLLNDREIRLTVSIGVAQYHAGQDDWQTLLQRADQALYRAKQDGRDRWILLETQDAPKGE